MKTVLVTGASGALGRAVIGRLKNDSGSRVVATSRRAGASVEQLDVRQHQRIGELIGRVEPELILHLAATFANDFDEAYAINVDATRHLLDAVLQSGRRTRVLVVGSAAEYGAVLPGENPVREDRVQMPVSIYGLTKAWQTQLAGLYARRGVDVVVARVFNLDGLGLSERLFVGRLQRQIAELAAGRIPAIEVGALSAVRDYLSTDDAAEQLLAIAALAEAGQVCHVASGVPVTMRDLLVRYLARHGLDSSVVREAAELSNRTGCDVPAIYADVAATLRMVKTWRERVEA